MFCNMYVDSYGWRKYMIWKLLTVILAAVVIVLIAVLLKIRAQLRDINEQLDFL